MKKQIVTTAAAMAVTALMAFQPMIAFAATANCGNGTCNTGCSIRVCQNSGCDSWNGNPQIISYMMRNSFCRK